MFTMRPQTLGASAGVLVERTPMQMVFTPFYDTTVVDPQPLRAEVTDFIETFGSLANLDITGTKYGGTAGSGSVATNILTVSGGNNTAVMEKTSVSSYTVPDAFVEVGVEQQGTSATQDILEVGIFLDGTAFITASIDRAASLAWIQVTNPSNDTRVAQVAYTVPAGKFRIGLGYMQNWAALYIDSGSGWVLVTGGDTTSYLNLNAPGTLTNLRAGLILASASATTWKFNKLRSGRFGAVGFRDPTLMTNRDGTPYISGGKAYVTASTNLVAGSGGATRNSVHEIDLATMQIETVGVFYTLRGGVFNADLNLQIVDNGDGTQELFWASWGTGPFTGGALDVLHAGFTGQFQKGTRIISAWTSLGLPKPAGGNAGTYDAMLWNDGTKWQAAFAQVTNTTSFGSSFWIASATSPDLTTWTVVGADTANQGYEGAKILKASGQYWVTGGGPYSGTKNARVYNSAMAYQGNLPATFTGGTSSDTRPHAMIFPSGSYQYMITFDDTRFNGVAFTWGKYIVQRSPRYV